MLLPTTIRDGRLVCRKPVLQGSLNLLKRHHCARERFVSSQPSVILMKSQSRYRSPATLEGMPGPR